MGLSGGRKCIFILSELSGREFKAILDDRFNDNLHGKDSHSNRRPRLDIDANEIAFRYLNSSI